MKFETRHPLYKTWYGMMDRCYNPKSKSYANYGGRGVIVCERWHDPMMFFVDMYPKPEPSDKYSLDRINPYGDYEPANCRWATANIQSRNRRNVNPYNLARELKEQEIIDSASPQGARLEAYHKWLLEQAKK